MRQKQKGNVLLYILIALALLMAVTYAVTRDTTGQSVSKLDDTQFELYAGSLISHATAANMAVRQMTQWGPNLDEILSDGPTEAGYTSNTNRQLHHPSGGGLNVFQANDAYFDGNGTTGWTLQGNINVEWSSTTATDLIYSFINLAPEICAAVNERLTGDPAIPTSTVNFTNTFTETGADNPFTSSACSECEGVMSLCISDGTTNAFYNIVGSR